METLLQDIRYSLRALKRTPGFTAAAAMVLALGIGASTSIFTVVNAVLIRPLPYPESGRLVMLWETNPRFNVGVDTLPVTPGSFMDWREQNTCFEQIAAFGASQLNLSGAGEPERLSSAGVSPNFFELMRATPKLGRSFRDHEENPGAARVVIISYGLWQRRLAGASDAIGKTLILDGEGYTIVGVAPEGFQFPRAGELPYFVGVAANTDVWRPMTLGDEFINRKRANHQLCVIARLKPGTTRDQAQTEISAIAGRIEQGSPDNQGVGVKVVPLSEQIVGGARRALLVLMAATGLVLLIACANVANLMLARAAARTREIAIRAALGATRPRIFRQLITEALLLSLAGGLAGTLLSQWGVRSLLAVASKNLPGAVEAGIDLGVLCFAVAISMVSSVLFGLAPALGASRTDLSEALKPGAAPAGGVQRNRLRSLLVISEVALTLVLLIGAGLMLKSLALLLDVDPGFKIEKALTLRIALPVSKYSDASKQIAFFQELNRRVADLPGVEAAGLISSAPLGGGVYAGGFSIEGRVAAPDEPEQTADRRMISPDYLNSLGIPLIEGRQFNDRDGQASTAVAMISRSFARRFFPGEDPIGKRIKLGGRDSTRPWLSIVGVAGDVRDTALDSDIRPCVYLPYPQFAGSGMTLIVRSSVDPMALVSALREEVWALDKDQPITDLKTMNQYVSESVAARRTNAMLLVVFAGLALVLASVGIYGVVAYWVTQRVHEVGIRIALGATPRDVIKLIVGRGFGLVIIGVAIGLVSSFALTRVMSSLLYGVSATDPATFASVSLLLTGVALLASYIPARRATKIDPMIALRHE
ncbi:MAG TPA: ABC transporter permease [Blastocatellia bacterium]|nr:ABC transporter permease [Blastocatellia bacterium]